MKEWLENLKVGDTVIVSGRNELVCTIERMTKTQIVLKDNFTKFNRKTGRSVGNDSWSTSYIFEPTEKEIKRITEETTRRNIINKLSRIEWKNYTTESLLNIMDNVQKACEK